MRIVHAEGGDSSSDDYNEGSVLARLRGATLTRSEQKVAELIIRDYPQAALLNGRDLAQLSGTSPATITRLVTKIGYANLDQMQGQLRRELVKRLGSPIQRLAMEPSPTALSARALVDRSIAIDVNNIETMRMHLDVAMFERVIESLCNGDRPVYVLGAKKAWTLATYFWIQLNQTRSDVHLLRVDDMLTDQLLDIPYQSLLVAFVPRRLIRTVIAAINEFKRAGAEVVIIADLLPPDSIGPSNALITVPTQGATIFDSYAAFITVINALIAGVVARKHELVGSRLAQFEGLGGEFGVWADSS